jgi:hypothetical protein
MTIRHNSAFGPLQGLPEFARPLPDPDPEFLSFLRPLRALGDQVFLRPPTRAHLRKLQNKPTEPPKSPLNGKNQGLIGAGRQRLWLPTSEIQPTSASTNPLAFFPIFYHHH